MAKDIYNGTDFVKLEKQLKVERYISNLIINYKNRINLETIILSVELTGILLSVTNYNISPFLTTLLVGLNAGKSLTEIQLEQKKALRDVEYEIQDYIRKTDIYQQTYYTYQNYLDEMSSFLNSIIDTTDSTELALFYQEMLNNGILSNIHHHSYDIDYPKYDTKLQYQISKYELDELGGCCVFTGKSVCRHMSSLLTDLEKRVGNDADNLRVISLDKNIAVEALVSLINGYDINLKANHQITILRDKDKDYFGYDPTNNFFLQFDNVLKKDQQYSSGHNIVLKEDKKDNINYLIKYANNPDILSKIFKEEKIKSFTPEINSKLIEKYNNIKNIYSKHTEEIETFYHDTKGDINIIATNIEYMIPKQIVKKLVLK